MKAGFAAFIEPDPGQNEIKESLAQKIIIGLDAE
jgi:hypothetical protein